MTFQFKSVLTCVLLATTAMAANAATLPLDAKLDSVTVYPQGADVFRLGRIDMPAGEHEIVLGDLPGDIDPQSIRVEGVGGTGVEIASVDAKPMPVSATAMEGERKPIEDKIEALANERNLLDQTVNDLATQRQFLLSMAEKQVTPGANSEPKPIDGVAVGGLLDVVGARLQLISKESHAARLRQTAIDKEVGELEAKLSIVAPTEASKMQVTINVTATQQTSAEFKVSYRVWQAGWQPIYDAKLAIADAPYLELIRRATVTQSTPEAWNNIDLTLSTSRPNGSTAAPDLPELALVYADAEGNGAASLSKARTANKSSGDKADLENLEVAKQELAVGDAPAEPAPLSASPVAQQQAALEQVGFQANYRITGRVTIDNSGQTKRVRIGSEQLNATLQAIITPRLDTSAYLTAKFKLGEAGPLLPGIVNLYRDRVYVGQGALPLLAAKEETQLGFGADDLLRVERIEVKRNSGEEGILTSSNVEERSWDITIKSLHDRMMPVTVLDRMPFSSREDVTVEPSRDITPPTEKNYKKRRGVMAWTFDLEAQGSKTIRFGYKVSLPENLKIGCQRTMRMSPCCAM